MKSRLNPSLVTLLSLTVTRVLVSNAWGSSSRQWNCAVALDLMSLPAGRCRSTPPMHSSHIGPELLKPSTCLKHHRKWSAPAHQPSADQESQRNTVLSTLHRGGSQRWAATCWSSSNLLPGCRGTWTLTRRIQVKMLQLPTTKKPSNLSKECA